MDTLFIVSYIALWLLVVVLWLLVVGLIRSVYDLRAQVEQLVGQPERRAPTFRVPLLNGEILESGDLASHAYALLFVTPTCPMCREAMTNLGPVRKRVGDQIVILCNGDRDKAERLAELVPRDVRFGLDEGGAVGKQFGINAAPMTVVVDGEGWIRSMGSIITSDDAVPQPEPATDSALAAAGVSR
jgi:hypothetical protein